jgi:hypothetical protein
MVDLVLLGLNLSQLFPPPKKITLFNDDGRNKGNSFPEGAIHLASWVYLESHRSKHLDLTQNK